MYLSAGALQGACVFFATETIYQQTNIMAHKNRWVDLALLGICTVAVTGLVLRTKIIFSIPFINYNNLLEGHSHFAFGGWVTLAIASLMVAELLPAGVSKKPVYTWLLGGMAASSWCTLAAFIGQGYGMLSIAVSAVFTGLTYIFAFVFVRHIIKYKPAAAVLLLAVSGLICLVLSSGGQIVIAYIFFSKTFNAILYRDALFTYLHFNYNGFFSLAILALIFNKKGAVISQGAIKNVYRFCVVLCCSIIPSLFLSYLWQNPNQWYRVMAVAGSFLLLLSLVLLIACGRTLRVMLSGAGFVTKLLMFLCLSSFMLKLLLQSFTIAPGIGNAIFGNRPVIMGFLHLVFLGFISPYILAGFTINGLLNASLKITRVALIVFAAGVICNEGLLVSQGLTTMLMHNGNVFSWLLWVAGILLFTATVLIAVARIKTKRSVKLQQAKTV
jgi:hypothetical protein